MTITDSVDGPRNVEPGDRGAVGDSAGIDRFVRARNENAVPFEWTKGERQAAILQNIVRWLMILT